MTNAQARCLSRPFAPCPQVTFVIHPVRLPNAGAGLQPAKPHAASSTRIAEKTSWYIERIAPAQPPLDNAAEPFSSAAFFHFCAVEKPGERDELSNS